MFANFRTLLAQESVLEKRFKDAAFIFEPKILQGWSATTNTFYGKGYVLTGNVTEFLDPIFSSGVTLATVSAQNASKLVIRHLKGENVDWEKEYMEPTMSGVAVFRTYVNAWYDGSLFQIFFSDKKTAEVKARICSVLAGYVWDEENTFVKQHEKSVKAVLNYVTAVS
jgi:flavin-dependent dehydrogenase